jgi:hypothetical protein
MWSGCVQPPAITADRGSPELSSTGFDGHWKLPLSGVLGQGGPSVQVLVFDWWDEGSPHRSSLQRHAQDDH